MVLVTDPAPAREVVGVLKPRNAFDSTIAALADADIGSGQLSVLSSHHTNPSPPLVPKATPGATC